MPVILQIINQVQIPPEEPISHIYINYEKHLEPLGKSHVQSSKTADGERVQG